LRYCAASQKVTGKIPDGVISPGVDSASNRNGYQEYFPAGKGGRCVGLTTLPPSCADCLEIWEPQPPGTLGACNGIAFPVPLLTKGKFIVRAVKHYKFTNLVSLFFLKCGLHKIWQCLNHKAAT